MKVTPEYISIGVVQLALREEKLLSELVDMSHSGIPRYVVHAEKLEETR
jgi:hypothetical protein